MRGISSTINNCYNKLILSYNKTIYFIEKILFRLLNLNLSKQKNIRLVNFIYLLIHKKNIDLNKHSYHQRLNIGLLIKNKQFSTNITPLYTSKTVLSENTDIFHKWLVGFTDGDGSFSIIKQNNR